MNTSEPVVRFPTCMTTVKARVFPAVCRLTHELSTRFSLIVKWFLGCRISPTKHSCIGREFAEHRVVVHNLCTPIIKECGHL